MGFGLVAAATASSVIHAEETKEIVDAALRSGWLSA